MKTNVYKYALLAAGLALFAAALYLYRPLRSDYTRVTVTGESTTEAAPDNAVVTFSVVTKTPAAVAAQQQNARKIEAVIKALETAGAGARQEIETSNYNLSPEENYSSSGPAKIVGYEARNTIRVTTGDLGRVGALIDAATAAGANSVEGIAFTLREDSAQRGTALGVATRQAMAKAEAIAASLNGKIVRVVETIEGGAAAPTVENYSNSSTTANMNGYSTRIMAGPLNVRGQVTLVVEIDARR
jgi:uncharacterized protein